MPPLDTSFAHPGPPPSGLPSPRILAEVTIGTGGLQGWIQSNIVPLVLLGVALIMLWIGGSGDNAGVAKRGVGLIIGLAALGIAVSGQGPAIGQALAGLITG